MCIRDRSDVVRVDLSTDKPTHLVGQGTSYSLVSDGKVALSRQFFGKFVYPERPSLKGQPRRPTLGDAIAKAHVVVDPNRYGTDSRPAVLGV